MANQDIIDLMNENGRLRYALAFYADPRRYDGPNLKGIEDDPYSPPNLSYRYDVTRDNGQIARNALEDLSW